MVEARNYGAVNTWELLEFSVLRVAFLDCLLVFCLSGGVLAMHVPATEQDVMVLITKALKSGTDVLRNHHPLHCKSLQTTQPKTIGPL